MVFDDAVTAFAAAERMTVDAYGAPTFDVARYFFAADVCGYAGIVRGHVGD